ncbi:hypothetical protein [Sorangium sp. So ce1335]|uniref:hypothetical protein n=1 Tax=Sorangium sp. So ce1335 TaxID=3133335 RepID=UPI003F6164FE
MTFITLPYSSGDRPPLHIRPGTIDFLLKEEDGTLLNELHGRRYLESRSIESLLSVIQGDEPLVEVSFLKSSTRVRGYIRPGAIELITAVGGVTRVHTSRDRDCNLAESPSELMARLPDEAFDCVHSDDGQAVYFRRDRLLGVSPLECSSIYAYSFDSRERVYSGQFEPSWVTDMTAAQVKRGRAFFRANRMKGFRVDQDGNSELHGAVMLAGLSAEAVLKVCPIAHPVSFAQCAAGQGGTEYRYDWVLERDAIHAIVPRNPGMNWDTSVGVPFLGLDTIDPVDKLLAQLDLASFVRLTRSSAGRGPNVPWEYDPRHPWAYYRPESILAMEARDDGTAIATRTSSHIVDETPEEVLGALVGAACRTCPGTISDPQG